MKTKTLLGIFLLIALVAGLSSCKDDDEIILFTGSQPNTQSGYLSNQITSTTIFINGSQTQDIGIANGKGGYSASSSDETVITVEVNDNRLLLTSHGKKGQAIVTVSDKKSNKVTLPVTVAYGCIPLKCINQRCFVHVNNELSKDEVLQAKVVEAMKSYSFMKDNEECLLQPVNLSKFLVEEEEGAFIVNTVNGTKSFEGTFKVKLDDTLSGKKGATFVFTYNGETHTFFYNFSYMDNSSNTRETGPIPFLLFEDVTASPNLESVSLPENSKVLYVLRANVLRTRVMK